MDTAETNEEIDSLLDVPTNTYIINASGWSITENITTEKKYKLIQHLLIDEVITKRRKNLQAFCLGMECLGVDFLVRSHPDLMKEIFVHSDEVPLTTERILSLISSTRPSSPPSHIRAYDFLMEFISQLGGKHNTVECSPTRLSTHGCLALDSCDFGSHGCLPWI